MRLRAEINALRASSAAAPSSSALGVSGVSLPPNSQAMQGVERTGSGYQGEIYDRDRDLSQQSSKRQKSDKKEDRVLGTLLISLSSKLISRSS